MQHSTGVNGRGKGIGQELEHHLSLSLLLDVSSERALQYWKDGLQVVETSGCVFCLISVLFLP